MAIPTMKEVSDEFFKNVQNDSESYKPLTPQQKKEIRLFSLYLNAEEKLRDIRGEVIETNQIDDKKERKNRLEKLTKPYKEAMEKVSKAFSKWVASM